MADTASWPWLEWVASYHPSLIIKDVCDQLHIQHSAQNDFLLLIWWHTHEYHTEHQLQSLAHYYTLPLQLLPTIDSFLQRYGSSLWPDSDFGFTNRDHLLPTSRYSSTGYYNVQLQNGIADQPYMSLHGTMPSAFYGVEHHGRASSSLGKLLQIFCLAMLKLSHNIRAALAAQLGTVDQALMAVIGRNVNPLRQLALLQYGTNLLGQFPAIEDGSRPSDREQQESGQAFASQQQYVSPALTTNPWPHQSQSQGQQQQQMPGTVVSSRYVNIAPAPAPHQHLQLQPSGYAAYVQPQPQPQPQPQQQQQQVQYQDHSVPMLQPPPSARTFSRRRRARQSGEVVLRRERTLLPRVAGADGRGQI